MVRVTISATLASNTYVHQHSCPAAVEVNANLLKFNRSSERINQRHRRKHARRLCGVYDILGILE